MPVRLILLRHGETDWNAEDRYQGRTDVDLNATGERQARAAVARFLAEALESADELVSVASPLRRARRTAEIALEAWIQAARRCRIPAFVELQRKITRHRTRILAAIEHGMSNGPVESINTKIRLLTRRAFGYRNANALIALALLALGRHRVTLPNRE